MQRVRVWTVVVQDKEDPGADFRKDVTNLGDLPLSPEVLAAFRHVFLDPEFFEFKIASFTQVLHITCADYPVGTTP